MNQNLYTEGKPVNSVNDAGGAAGDTNKYGAQDLPWKIIHNRRKESRAADEITDKAGKYEKGAAPRNSQEKIVDNFFYAHIYTPSRCLNCWR